MRIAFIQLAFIVVQCMALVPSNTQQQVRREFLQTATSAIITFGITAVPSNSYAQDVAVGGKAVYGNEQIMYQKAHGTSEIPVQVDLSYGVSNKLADSISNYNRQFAERAGYFQYTSFEDAVLASGQTGTPITFYDSVTGKPLFVAPIGRSADQFLKESKIHGWPSFRDEEVVWDNVRILKGSGETVSMTGTHLGKSKT